MSVRTRNLWFWNFNKKIILSFSSTSLSVLNNNIGFLINNFKNVWKIFFLKKKWDDKKIIYMKKEVNIIIWRVGKLALVRNRSVHDCRRVIQIECKKAKAMYCWKPRDYSIFDVDFLPHLTVTFCYGWPTYGELILFTARLNYSN